MINGNGGLEEKKIYMEKRIKLRMLSRTKETREREDWTERGMYSKR